MPFRYGTAELTRAPVLYARVEIEASDGKRAVGYSADCLPPRWFDKDPAKTFEQNVADQLLGFQTARAIYLDGPAKPAAASELWQAASARLLGPAPPVNLNALTLSFGGAFIERAMIDALLRLREKSLFDALSEELLGAETARTLPKKPAEAILCRHTVGLGDPLIAAEIPESEALSDGLPQALEEDIEFYGLRAFKIKLCGDQGRDLERLSRLGVLIHQRCPRGYLVTLDGNEQYAGAQPLLTLFEELRRRPYGGDLLDAALYLEQPFSRDVALSPDVAPEVAELSKALPLIIDESDDRLDSFERAAALGYRGVSHKSCKGIFKSLHNRALITRLNRVEKRQDQTAYFQTGEDLATTPVLPLQQDLAMLAALGVEHAERNGHHYFRGLDHLTPAEQASALERHRSLYEERQDSVFLKMLNGELQVATLQCPGFGYASVIEFEAGTPIEDWTFEKFEDAGHE